MIKMDKCRLCLKNSKKLRSLFEKENEVLFIDMITSFSNIKIYRDDKVTSTCSVCCRKLREAFDFKNMIELSNSIFNEDNPQKRISFNNLDEIKIKVEIDVKEEINKNYFNDMVLEKIKDDKQFLFNDTIIKRIEVNESATETENKTLNVYDYVKTFKDEPSDDDMEQDYDFEDYGISDVDDEYIPPPYLDKKQTKVRKGKEDYDFEDFGISDVDDEYIPPPYLDKKQTKVRKGKENRDIKGSKNKVIKKNKLKNNKLPKILIKPVFLEDIAMVRTKVEVIRRKPRKKVALKKKMCNFCGIMTASMKSHILIHTGKRIHKCDTCDKAYYTEAILRAHKKKHEGRKYKCDQCIASFIEKASLEGHMLVHENENKFVCEICKKTFKRIASLRRHVRMHNSANKNIKCDQCNMTFFTNSALKHHVRVHTGERPFRCEMCSQGYSYKHDFNRHCFKKHGVFLKRRKVYVMNEEVLVKERELLRALMLKLRGVEQGEDPFKEFEVPQGYKALEQAIKLLESKQLPIDVHI